MKPVISIVEDNIHFQQALIKIIGESDFFLLGKIYGSAEAAEEMIQHPPDIAIIDILLPGMSGTDLIKRIKKLTPQTQYLICSMHDDDDKIFTALENGATGYILKESTTQQITDALMEVTKGGAPMSPYVAKRVINFFHKPNLQQTEALLSEREREVLHLLAKGLLYKEIAGKLNISAETVKKHLNHVYQKLHVQNKVEALNKLRLL